MKWTRNKRAASVLGLTLDGGRLDAALVRRTNGSVELRKSTSAPLTLDLTRNEPELVGREIRNLLDAAGIKERRCVVGVPAHWVLALPTALPDLADEDIDSFLELEAERGFPNSPDQLLIRRSRIQTASGGHVTQLAVMRDQIARYEAILAAAQLRPIQLSPAIAALPGAIAEGPAGCLTAVVVDAGVTLLLSTGGGIVNLRTLDHVYETEGSERRILSDVIARELRVTLAQLPDELRAPMRLLQIAGTAALADRLARDLESRAGSLGFEIVRLNHRDGREHGLKVTGEAPLSGAFSLAVQSLSVAGESLNFLPPKPTLWQQISRRYSGRGLVYSGATAGVVAVALIALFLVQQIRLSGLRTEWAAMETRVAELEEVQGDIRMFRSWHDANPTTLTILRDITAAFPEEGSITAKSVEIRQQSNVSVSGITRDHAVLNTMLDQLRATPGIADVKVDTIRGSTPMQYSFNFQWRGAR